MILGRLRAWTRGTGNLSVIDIIVITLVLLVSVTGLGLALVFHGQAAGTKRQLTDLKSTIYARCEQRQTYDQSNHASVVADVELYQQILALQQQVPLPADPEQRALSLRYRDVIVQAKTRKEKAAEQGVIGTCAAYR